MTKKSTKNSAKPLKAEIQEVQARKLLYSLLQAFDNSLQGLAEFLALNTTVLGKIIETGNLGINAAKIKQKLQLKDELLFDLYMIGDCTLYQLIATSQSHQSIFERVQLQLFLEFYDGLSKEKQLEYFAEILKKTPLTLETEDPYREYSDISFRYIYGDLAEIAVERLRQVVESTCLLLGDGLRSFLALGCERMIAEEVICQPVDRIIDIIWNWDTFYSLGRILYRISEFSEEFEPQLDSKLTYKADIDSLLVDLVSDRLPSVTEMIASCLQETTQKTLNLRLQALGCDLVFWRKLRLNFNPTASYPETTIDLIRGICGELSDPQYNRKEWQSANERMLLNNDLNQVKPTIVG